MGGALPPTDPRILDLTEAQIDLEFELILLDKLRKEGKGEVFEDDSFEDWDKESDAYDERLSDPYPVDGLPKKTIEYGEDEWVAVE